MRIKPKNVIEIVSNKLKISRLSSFLIISINKQQIHQIHKKLIILLERKKIKKSTSITYSPSQAGNLIISCFHRVRLHTILLIFYIIQFKIIISVGSALRMLLRDGYK